MTNATLLIIFIVALLLSLISLCVDRDWADWTGTISGIILLLCFIIAAVRKEKEPIRITTSVSPRIDTVVVIGNGVADTTYTYYFERNKEK